MTIKLINIVFDLGILYLIYLLSNKNVQKTFIYAINPVTLLITTLHGQFDVIPVFFILFSIYLLNKKRDFSSILSLSLAIALKTWPLLFFIPIFRNLKNKKIIVLVAIFPIFFVLIYSFLFKSSLIDISKTIIHYQGLWGIWGPWSWIGKIRMIIQKTATMLFLISFFGYSLINTTKNTVKNIYLLLFFFFTFTTNFSIQYFTWLVPFLILIKPKNFLYLIIFISIYLFSFYYAWLFCLGCKTIPFWLTLTQNTIGFILWLSFIRIWCISKKIS